MGINRRWSRVSFVTAALALVAAGCGDDDQDADGGARDGSVDGSVDGGGSGRGGAGGASNAGAGGRMGTGGRMSMNMCSPDVEPETRCGDTDCPALGANVAQCTVSCCVNDRCGTLNSNMNAPRECEPLAEPDPRCPDYDGPSSGQGGQNVMRQGCCTPDNQCGVISSLSNTCITSSPFLMLPEDPQSCDQASEMDAGP
jgi:hypothetical protein